VIRATGVGRSFGGRVLLEPSDWFLADTDRVGLVGPNGSGKSTWLKMLAGIESPDEGRIDIPKAQRVGYLAQFGLAGGRGTVWEEAARAFGSLLALRAERERLERELEGHDLEDRRAEELLHLHESVEQEIRRLGEHESERKTDRVLRGLGFGPADFVRPVTELSGGWQMRVSLARILLEAPDILLLDEPTNHLDLEAREWLEGFLKEYPGSVVLVSHDRFRYKNTKAAQVQCRIRALEKMERVTPPEEPPRTIRFKFPQPGRTGRIALELRGVGKSYGPLRVFREVSLQLERGQKVALTGPNGAGKSTLMRILAGVEPIDAGERSEGLKVTIDHFAQDQADRLVPDRTILQEAMARAPVALVPQLRGLLGAFLFTGEAVEKKISVLSGGERNRLALALMLLHPSNVLLLDEPTNHLDMAAKDVLLEALRSFEGTLVFVSHDRYFLSGLANRVIEVGGGGFKDYPGDYDGYAYRKQQQEAAALAAAEAAGRGAQARGAGGGDARGLASGPGPGTAAGRDAGLAEEAPSPSLSGVTRGRLSPKQVRALEAKIAELEDRKEKLEALLSREDLYRDPEKSGFYLGEYQEVSRSLEAALEEWAGE